MTDTDRRTFLQQTAGAVTAFALPVSLADPHTPWLPGGAPLQVGLVGCGRQGRAILAELQKMEQVQVSGVCDLAEGRLRGGLRRARGAVGYADHRKMLDEEKGLQAVVIATPTHRHREVAVDALQAGKHVYCEAPLAATIEDAQAIARAARDGKNLFQTGLLARSNPIYKLSWAFQRSGALRDLVSLRGQSRKKTSWRAATGGDADWKLDPQVTLGLEGEWGTHQFDVFQWFVGDYPDTVRGAGAVRHYRDGREVADAVQIELGWQDGLRGVWQGDLCSSLGGTYELLSGSNATMKLAWTAGWMFKEADSPTQGWEVYASRETYYGDEGITLIADATKLAKQGKLKEGIGLPHPPLYYGLHDFVVSVAESKSAATSAEQGLRAAVVGILAHRAVTTGTEQAIDRKLFELG